MLKADDMGIDLFEVKKEEDGFWFRQSDVHDMPNTSMFVDNTCIEKRGNMDTKKILYRISRVAVHLNHIYLNQCI